MRTICKNIAFSETGKCLLGQDCICEKNKLWLEEPSGPLDTGQAKLVLEEMGETESSIGKAGATLRWVKAWKRKPEPFMQVIIRNENDNRLVVTATNEEHKEEWSSDDSASWFFDDTEWLEEIPAARSTPSDKQLTGAAISNEERDVFAMSFLAFALTDPRAQALIQAGTPAGPILDLYKDRAYIDEDSSK